MTVATATGWAVMTGYRIGFQGSCAIALGGALSSLLIPARVRRSNRAIATPS
jgi:hypothetical protein